MSLIPLLFLLHFKQTTLRDYISAMEVGDIDRELPALLTELGVNYDPDRLSDALKDRQLEVTQKALTVAMVFGDVITKILAVSALCLEWLLFC